MAWPSGDSDYSCTLLHSSSRGFLTLLVAALPSAIQVLCDIVSHAPTCASSTNGIYNMQAKNINEEELQIRTYYNLHEDV